MEEKTQYDLRSREAVAALNTNLAPPFRTGNASFATSAAVASKVADAPVPDAADVMTGEAGKTAKAAKKAAKAAANASANAASANAASANAANAKVKVQKPKSSEPVSVAASQNPSESTSQITAARIPIDLDDLADVPRKKSQSRSRGAQRKQQK